MTSAESLTASEQAVDRMVENIYINFSPALHAVTDRIVTEGTGQSRGTTFRVDQLEDVDLDMVRGILRFSVGQQLPRFGYNHENEYVQQGLTPVVEARHAQFEQRGDYFETEDFGVSAMLRVPIYDTEAVSREEERQASSGLPLTLRQAIKLGVAAAGVNVMTYDGLVSRRPSEVAGAGLIGGAVAVATAVKLLGNPFAREA